MNKLKGFTLVEIMISVLILGVGLTLVANSYLVALKGVNTASNIVGAMSLAKEKFETLEFLSLKEGLAVSSSRQSLKKAGAGNYEFNQEIVEISQPEALAKNLVQACLNFSWQEQNSVKNVILSTYLTKQKQ